MNIGISACLFGHAVRYDGLDKYTPLIVETLRIKCGLIPICPEMEIGLGVPRNKIQLVQVQQTVRVREIENPAHDVSDLLKKSAEKFIKSHSLSGLILQDKSPSCGIDNSKLYSENGELIGMSSGLFASTIKQLLPDLPMCCASQLSDLDEIQQFFQQLQFYHSHYVDYCS